MKGNRMKLIDRRNKFLELAKGSTLYNPELIDMQGNIYVFLIDNPNMNDADEVERLLRQAWIEDLNFIILFEDKVKLESPFANLLLYKLLTETGDEAWKPTILTIQYDEKNDRFSKLNFIPGETRGTVETDD